MHSGSAGAFALSCCAQVKGETGQVSLPLVKPCPEGGVADCDIEVGVLQQDQGVLAAQLQ